MEVSKTFPLKCIKSKLTENFKTIQADTKILNQFITPSKTFPPCETVSLGCALTFASEAKFEIEAKISFRLEAKKKPDFT
jgi:hypothetical protein